MTGILWKKNKLALASPFCTKS